MNMPDTEIYTIDSYRSDYESIEATIVFDKNHPVFSGHFPGNPIVPGVVQVQIIKELMEKKTGKKLVLNQGKNIKFLSIISPVKNPKVEVWIEFSLNNENLFPAQAAIRSGDLTFMKFSGIFKRSTEINKLL